MEHYRSGPSPEGVDWIQTATTSARDSSVKISCVFFTFEILDVSLHDEGTSMALRCLFIVQGEGRGHLTQALALRHVLIEAGHRVEAAIVGQSPRRAVPSFFDEAFQVPVHYVDSPSFVSDGEDRSVRPWKTLFHELGRSPAFVESLSTIDTIVERHDPDVIVNFFEPLGGGYAVRHRPSIPIVAVGHQYMFHHSSYRFPPGRWVERWGAQMFARITAWGASRRLALSLYPAPNCPDDDLAVLPPLLRSSLFDQPLGQEEPFFLVYLLNSGYAREVIEWHERNPNVQLHCFWDRPNAASVECYDRTLTFHQLDDEKFLALMARCQGVVSTAGFESVAEAMYLGKPVQVVPVDGHFEQLCNAFDTVRAGAGVRSSCFDISRLQAFLPHSSDCTDDFRQWVQSSRIRFVQEIEAVADSQDVRVPSSSLGTGEHVLEPV